MKFQRAFIKKIIAFSYAFIFSVPLIYSQIKPNEQRMNKANYKYGEDIELKVSESLITEDTMSIKLDHFINKIVFEGNPPVVYVMLDISKGLKKTSLRFIVEGGNDNVLEFWNGYKFQMKRMNYEESIKIVISKNKTNFKYGEVIELKINENFIAEDAMSIKLESFAYSEDKLDPTHAVLDISKDNKEKSFFISLIKHEAGHYAPLFWKGYKLQLKSFSPYKSIKIIVSKKK